MSALAKHYDVIKSPVITEKSTLASEYNKVVFKVADGATKPQIKAAVEAIFGVKVEKVNTINLPAKVKRFKGKLGVRSETRKAVVSLAEGNTIDITGGVK